LCPSHDTFTLVPRLFGKAEWTAKIPCGLGPYGDSRTVSCTARSPVIVSKIWPLAETTWAKPLPPTPLASTAGFSDRLQRQAADQVAIGHLCTVALALLQAQFRQALELIRRIV
jgi:hypothetical protein